MSTGYQIKQRQTTAALRALVESEGKEELRLHCAIVDLLAAARLPGVIFWHTPNGGKRTKTEAAQFQRMGVLAGVSDIAISLPGGRFGFVEVKARRGRLSEGQEAFLAGMDKNGHLTAVVRDLGAATQVLVNWGAIRQARVAA